jgi:hypothetical protein
MIRFVFGWLGIACSPVYFWWMHRISHPAMTDIKERVQDVHRAVLPNEGSVAK